tara:strand:+ start:2193 stop:3092 length:900 start_codon:yes stop_codon:yes gene_type:complete
MDKKAFIKGQGRAGLAMLIRKNMNNRKVYVTNSKISMMLKKVKINAANIEINGIFHSDLSKILSIPELKYLAIYKEAINDIEGFEYHRYEKTVVLRPNKFIFESGIPSYHGGPDCERLQANFENYEIPAEIEDKGEAKIEEFRKFFKDNITLFNTMHDAFMAQVKSKFRIRNTPKKVEFNNTGSTRVSNLSAQEINKNIQELLKEMEEYRNSSEEIKKEIKMVGYRTHAARIWDKNGNEIRRINIPGSVTKQWHDYKNSLKHLLKEYFKIRLNPEFMFDEEIMKQLGFNPCSHCLAVNN